MNWLKLRISCFHTTGAPVAEETAQPIANKWKPASLALSRDSCDHSATVIIDTEESRVRKGEWKGLALKCKEESCAEDDVTFTLAQNILCCRCGKRMAWGDYFWDFKDALYKLLADTLQLPFYSSVRPGFINLKPVFKACFSLGGSKKRGGNLS